MESSSQNYTTKTVRSPRLKRSRSSTVSLKRSSSPETCRYPLDSGHKSCISRSTALISRNKDVENRNPANSFREIAKKTNSHPIVKVLRKLESDKKPLESREISPGILQHRRIPAANTMSKDVSYTTNLKKARSVTGSPSAWALSPGRSPTPVTKLKNSGGLKEKTGGMSGVLRLFRSNKRDSVKEEAIHQLRVLNTRLIQWRFVNAKGETSLNTGNRIAEKKLVTAWLNNSQLRNTVVEKRIQIQKLKNEIKIRGIVASQVRYLNEWERIDKRNLEAVTKSARVLQSASIKIPLVQGSTGNITSIYREICTAADVMHGIETTVQGFLLEVNKLNSMLVELGKIARLEMEGLEELMSIAATMTSLMNEESSLRAHLIQALKEDTANQRRLTNGSRSGRRMF